MKKFLGIVLALALMLTLVSVIPASAEAWDWFNIDWIKTVTGEGEVIADHMGAYGTFVADGPVTGIIGNVHNDVVAGAQYIYFMGWYMPLTEMADVGIRLDGGAVDYDSYEPAFQQALCDALAGFDNNPNVRRFEMYIPIQEGNHTLEIVVQFPDSTEKVVFKTYYSNAENIALNKPVTASLLPKTPSGTLISANEFWDTSFVTDGTATLFTNDSTLTVTIGDKVYKPLGFYVSAGTGDVDCRVYIDLEGMYELSSVDILAMGFNNIAFPNTYKVLASTDGSSWREIGGDSGITSNDYALVKSHVASGQARYICIQITKFNLLEDGSGIYYAGFGEVEVFGTKVGDVSSGTMNNVYSNYTGAVSADPGQAAWTGFTTGDLDYTFSFRTDVSFYAIGFPSFWGAAGTPTTIEFKKDGETALKFDYVFAGDGAKLIYLPSELEKGEYEVTITINDTTELDDDWKTANGVDLSTQAYSKYLVFGFATENPLSGEYCAFERGSGVAIDLYSGDINANKLGFVTFDYIEPTDSPATADASMVVFIVAAAAIALVILKKKQFF